MTHLRTICLALAATLCALGVVMVVMGTGAHL